MRQSDVVELILQKCSRKAQHSFGSAFCPTNIALVKYWGKREPILNLPMTDSLSISLADKGATTHIQLATDNQDRFFLNGHIQASDSSFSKRLSQFLDLFRFNQEHYEIKTNINIPLAAGLASSACGFAALMCALDQLYDWKLSSTELSILARLGSGSACRSVYPGFVLWKKGMQEDGMDSFAIPIIEQWPELRIGLLLINQKIKAISSREAMQLTRNTSYLYDSWPQQVAHDLNSIHDAILSHDFDSFGSISEHNALSMHATMISSWPPIVYSTAESLMAMQSIWKLRQQGLKLYFTQDAGPNLKLLFLAADQHTVLEHFPNLEVVKPFTNQ